MLLPLTSLEPNHHLQFFSLPQFQAVCVINVSFGTYFKVPSVCKAWCTSDGKGNKLAKLLHVGSRAQARKWAVSVRIRSGLIEAKEDTENYRGGQRSPRRGLRKYFPEKVTFKI